MATVLTHAALPLLAGRAWRPADVPPRRLALVAVLLALWPDADYLGLLFDVRPEDALGHRGLTHSLLVAVAVAALAALAAFPLRRFKPVFLFLAASAVSHPLLDALARGEGGVALFAPLTAVRFSLPLRPLHTIPLGINEAFGKWGALIFLGELLVVLAPLFLVVRLVELRRQKARVPPGLLGLAALWLLVLSGVAITAPSLFFGASPPSLAAADFKGIPLDGLPDGKLLTRFGVLQAQGLFDRPLAAATTPWSSTFFPSWYGAEAGRWRDGKLTLVGRTLFGFHGPFAPLSPAEKYDAAVGDSQWSATQHALEQSHNGHPRFWFGLCNGVSAAALQYPEPFRTVDAVAPGGAVVRFHPQDVKALLAASNYWNQSIVEVGDSCEVVSLDSGQACSMNPAALVVALTNRLGLARQSFLIDVHPSRQNQYYPVASATVRLTRAPYAAGGATALPELAGRFSRLVDVEVNLALSSTTLGFAPGDVPEGEDPTRYRHVGLHEVPFTWKATLALSEDDALVGGRWNGDPPIGPDSIAFLSGGPLLTDGGFVDFNPGLKWSVVEALARASADGAAAAPRVDVGALLDGGVAIPAGPQ